jgi:hypothetical protein
MLGGATRGSSAAAEPPGRYVVMSKRHVCLMLAGLALAFGLAIASSVGSVTGDGIEILDDPRPSATDTIDLGRRFGTAPCVSKQPGKTILEVLLPDAKRILIHRFDSGEWGNLEAVKGYIKRLLSAEPEGGMLSASVHWAELRPLEILASVEFANGQRQPLQVANGYAHFQDGSGCEWWARYLGPDRSRWVVRP